jgi:hypothetical protein
MSYFKSVNIGLTDTPIIDAFGRQRFSSPYTIFDSKHIVGKNELFYDEKLSGVGTTSVHLSSDSCVLMSVSANNAYAIRQTKMRFNYQPGKSQMLLLTGVFGEPVADTEFRVGYFNTSVVAPYTANRDGIYFGSDGTNIYVAVSKNGTENKKIQSDWNLDKMDGTGPSGIDLDWSKSQILFVDFEWLGVGRVRTGVVINGIIYYVHEFLHANNIDGTYMISPNHSVRYEVRSSGGTLAIKHICCSVISEGATDPTGIIRSVDDASGQLVSTALEGLIGIRLNSNNYEATVDVIELDILTDAANVDSYWVLALNPVYVTTPTWNSAGSSSAIEYALGGATTTMVLTSSSGVNINSGFISKQSRNTLADISSLLRLGIGIDGTRDEIWLGVKTFSSETTFRSSLTFKEISNG